MHNLVPENLSIFETTPTSLSPEIADFCASIGSVKPVFVDVDAPPDAREGWCFLNVATKVAAEGGRPLHGWIIWLARVCGSMRNSTSPGRKTMATCSTSRRRRTESAKRSSCLSRAIRTSISSSGRPTSGCGSTAALNVRYRRRPDRELQRKAVPP